MKPCATCSTKPIKNGIYKAHLKSFVKKNLPKSTKEYSNKKSGYKIEMSGLKPNKTIFYFGTDSRDFRKSIQMRDRAYGKLKNSGVTKSDAKGNATFYLTCPQIYKEPLHKRIYSRHFHFLYYNRVKSVWSEKLYTHKILCDIHREDVKKYMKTRNVKIVDALPEKYYREKHIYGALNIPHNKKISLSKVVKMLGKKKSVPIIVYCYSATCNAAEKVCEKLDKMGYHNIIHYVDGISKWNGKVGKK
jgi:rhodanese-related sulfurtransferase